MIDARLLLWVKWRQSRGTVFYWLRIVGFDPAAKSIMERVYLLYLLAIAVGWLFLMWSYAIYAADTIGSRLTPTVAASVVGAVPWLVLLLAVWLAVAYLRSAPYKMRLNDLTYLGSSPVSRRIPVAIAFTTALARTCVVALPAAVLAAIALARGLGADEQPAVVQAAWAALLLSVLITALAWLAGLARVLSYSPRRAYLLWLAPFLLVALAVLAPGQVLWPAQVFARSLRDGATTVELTALAAMALAALGAVGLVGGRVNVVAVAEGSSLFGQGRAYGWFWPPAASRPSRLAARVRPTARAPLPRLFVLPGIGVPLARSALSYVRQPTWPCLSAFAPWLQRRCSRSRPPSLPSSRWPWRPPS